MLGHDGDPELRKRKKKKNNRFIFGYVRWEQVKRLREPIHKNVIWLHYTKQCNLHGLHNGLTCDLADRWWLSDTESLDHFESERSLYIVPSIFFLIYWFLYNINIIGSFKKAAKLFFVGYAISLRNISITNWPKINFFLCENKKKNASLGSVKNKIEIGFGPDAKPLHKS